MTYRSPIGAYFTAILCAFLFVISTMSACDKGQRQDTLHTSLVAVNVARDRFITWDLDHQRAIVAASSSREEAQQKIGEYRALQSEITGWFVTVYRALAIAANANDDPSFRTAVQAATNLVDSVKRITATPERQ